MSQNITTFTITLGQVTNNGVVCKNPVITIIQYPDAVVNCIDELRGVYQIEVLGDIKDTCFRFLVQCAECDVCPPVEITKCLCEDSGDCDPCQICIDGVCEDQCKDGEVCDNGVCKDCVTNDDCPCNQVCSNGKCVCPPGFFPSGATSNLDPDCCIECLADTDCELCEICENGICVDKECTGGACDPSTGDCVECNNDGDCDGDNECCTDNQCKCCDGFKKVGGVCVPEDECDFNDDCAECETCVNGVCVPIICPPGKVCVNGTCVDRCPCPVGFYCLDGGCIPCEGSCDTGCISPCVCDTENDICIENKCQGPCTNGAECGDGCGCLDGQCVSCFEISCTGTDCENALGCECDGNNCVPSDSSDCSQTNCDTFTDCGVGCTCYEGTCVPCDSFMCSPTNECGTQDGCECAGGDCVGVDIVCADTISITKNDINCTLTGELQKSNCCACSKLTVDAKGRTTGSTNEGTFFEFILELRKGEYDGVSADSNPLLSDVSHPDIVENDTPTIGSGRLIMRVTRTRYRIEENGSRTFLGNSTTIDRNELRSFGANSATLTWSSLLVPSIGFEVITGNEVTVVRSTEVQIFKDSTFEFENTCDYEGKELVASWEFVSAVSFSEFSTFFGNEQGITVASPGCRLPVFRWYKSSDSTFDEAPFRKRYIEQTSSSSGLEIFQEVLARPEEDELDSCNHYRLETDCTCADPVEDWIVFCNPDNYNFELASCNRELTILDFDTCIVNQDPNITFRVVAGTIDKTWTYATRDTIVNIPLVSETTIEKVTFSIVCDVEGICDVEYDVPSIFGQLIPIYTSECALDGSNFTLTFNPEDTTGSVAIDNVRINNQIISAPNLSVTLSPGTYEATVNWAGGCEPSLVTITVNCCSDQEQTITRNCDGTINCEHREGYVYSTSSGAVISDVCQYVLDNPGILSILVTPPNSNCPQQIITVPATADNCCSEFDVEFNQIQGEQVEVIVFNAVGTVTVTALRGIVTAVIPNRKYIVSGYQAGNTDTITATDSICGSESQQITISDCLIDFSVVQTSDCKLRTTLNETLECPCEVGEFEIRPDVSVVNNQVIFAWDSEVTFPEGISLSTGDLEVSTTSNPTPVIFSPNSPQGGNSLAFDIPTVSTGPEQVTVTGSFRAGDVQDDSVDEVVAAQLVLRINGTSLPVATLPSGGGAVTTSTVTVDGLPVTPDSTNVYNFDVQYNANLGQYVFDLRIVFSTSLGDTYSISTTTVRADTGKASNLAFTVENSGETTCSETEQIRFQLSSVSASNGCTYDVTDHTFILDICNGILQGGEVDIRLPLRSSTSNSDVRIDYLVNDELISTDYVDPNMGQSIYPVSGALSPGTEYEVLVSCGSCALSKFITPTCAPVVTSAINGCNTSLTVNITGVPGTYRLTSDFTSNQSVTISSSSTSTSYTYLAASGFAASTSKIITVENITSGASATTIFTPLEDLTASFSIGDCDNANSSGVYTTTFTTLNGRILQSLSIVSPAQTTEVIDGNQITGMLDSTSYSVLVTDTVGCTTTLSGIQQTCANGVPSQISIADVSVNESETAVTLTVTANSVQAGNIGFTYTTADGTAIAGTDYTAASAVAGSITAGNLTSTFPINISGGADSIVDGDKTFTVTIAITSGNAVLGSAVATVTIIDDDNLPSVSVDGPHTIAEDDGTVTFTVTLDSTYGSNVTVDYTTNDIDATAGADYTAASGTLTFTPGQVSKTVDVTITNDSVLEGTEQFAFELLNPVNCTIADGQSAAVIVDDDEIVPVISISGTQTVSEDVGTALITVALDRAPNAPVSVDVAVLSGTADQFLDYDSTSATQLPQTLMWNPGDPLLKTITLVISNDDLQEGDEVVNIGLNNAAGGIVSSSANTITITIQDECEYIEFTAGYALTAEYEPCASTKGTQQVTLQAGQTFEDCIEIGSFNILTSPPFVASPNSRTTTTC